MVGKAFENYLRELRQKQRLSLREVGEKVGISTSYLSQIETGERVPSAEILRRLAPAYGVPVRDLLEVAGYLDEPEAMMSDGERLEWAFGCVLTDPEYRFGNRLRGEELTPAAKRFIIEVYEKCTNRKLL
jgi:transcriptional regulator with XRE-family HTH domain